MYHNQNIATITGYADQAFEIKDFDWWIDFDNFQPIVNATAGIMKVPVHVQLTGGKLIFTVYQDIAIPEPISNANIVSAVLAANIFKDSTEV